MARRLLVSVGTIGLAFGSMLLAAGAASAAPSAAHPTIHSTTISGYRPGGLMARPGGVNHFATHAGHPTDESTNWSGYAVTGANGAFSSVSATWTQPAATCSTNKAQYASFWVGLDGFSSDSVEQTGTDSDCSKGKPQYYGWYEMFPAFPVNFTNPVSPGDSMSASVTFSGTSTYTLVLKDTTKGWTQTITKNQAGLDRSSAEVITEAPSSGNKVLPLADFSAITYSSSTANGTSIGSQNPTQITMINSSGADKDSTSAIGAGGGFSNTWIRAS